MIRAIQTAKPLSAIACAPALLAALAGCSPRPAPSAPTAHVRAARTTSVVAASASAGVQAMPEYAKARKECALGRYRQAADILVALERSPSLSEEQRAFCRAQEEICLGHLEAAGGPHPAVPRAFQSASISLAARSYVRPHPAAGGASQLAPLSLPRERGGSAEPADRGTRGTPAEPGVSVAYGPLPAYAGRLASSRGTPGHASWAAGGGVASKADCGPRALLLACREMGVETSVAALAKAAGTGPSGTSLAGLKRAAEAIKLRAEGVQTSREALPELPVPAIAWTHGDHYVAVLALEGRGESGTAVIHDPNEAAERTISQEELLQSCGGYVLTLSR